MSDCTKNNEAAINNCQSDGGCGTQERTNCCGFVDPAQNNLFNDDIELKQRLYNERKIVIENEKIYREFRRDFNPVVWGIAGLLLGTIVGATVEQILMIGADVTYTAIFGLFLGVTICSNKNKANNQKYTNNK